MNIEQEIISLEKIISQQRDAIFTLVNQEEIKDEEERKEEESSQEIQLCKNMILSCNEKIISLLNQRNAHLLELKKGKFDAHTEFNLEEMLKKKRIYNYVQKREG